MKPVELINAKINVSFQFPISTKMVLFDHEACGIEINNASSFSINLWNYDSKFKHNISISFYLLGYLIEIKEYALLNISKKNHNFSEFDLSSSPNKCVFDKPCQFRSSGKMTGKSEGLKLLPKNHEFYYDRLFDNNF